MRLRPLLLCLSGAALLAGCATASTKSAALPVCDGKHRRPANPYGSVLAGGLKPAVASLPGPAEASGDKAAAAEPAKAKGEQVSRAGPRGVFASCGSDAA